LRVGVPCNYFFDMVDPDVVTAVRAAVAVMESLGAQIYEIELTACEHASAASWAIAYTESFAFHRDNFFARSRDYTPAFLHKITGAACLSAEERVLAGRVRELTTGQFIAALQGVDVILTPTTSYPSHPIDGPSPESLTHSLTRAISLTGLPSLSLPCGFASGGLPVGLQLTGRAWEESTVLRLGHCYEQASGWYRHRAPMNAELSPPVHAPQPALPSAVDPQWILDYARLTGLSFVTVDDAEPIAQSIGPQMTQLKQARGLIEAGMEPPVRPARHNPVR
jgi:Asp-tRNA(Asn)/Glu-tRNA(Gln) amidotransferase A subunit family amidase